MQQMDARVDGAGATVCVAGVVCIAARDKALGYGSRRGYHTKAALLPPDPPSPLVLQSAAAEFHISHQSVAAVVWTVREVHAHSVAQSSGAGAFGVPFQRAHYICLGEALNIWSYSATPIKIGGGGEHMFRAVFPKTHHNRLEEALNVWYAYWANPIKIGSGATHTFHISLLKMHHNGLKEALGIWHCGPVLRGVLEITVPTSRGGPERLVLEGTQQKSRWVQNSGRPFTSMKSVRLWESKIQEQHLDGIVEWDHEDIVNWVRGEMGMWDLCEQVVMNTKRKCAERECQ
ncbi:hypothetical protein B0H10DRAFT_1952057 [Mycena sp. CBHHK59/15]|nr:hypothetical protein B0H10DRAFT_1952057 [Mycena sp. CBHHK59/15]